MVCSRKVGKYMAITQYGKILTTDINDIINKAIAEFNAATRRNLGSHLKTLPSEVSLNNIIDNTNLDNIARNLNYVNENTYTTTQIDDYSIIYYSVVNGMNTALVTYAGKPKVGNNSGCKSGCVGLCQGCSGTCTGDCTGDCTGTCSGTCSGGCGGCTGTCKDGCYNGCKTGCTSCSGTCDGTCTNICAQTCGGTGVGQVCTNCADGCQGSCGTGCQVDCGTCARSCSSGVSGTS